ncbi:MAG: DUF1501 domain-containing protein [Planctomycetes bacterium]|nr:DUF1501 domain-containing protein [Planctomycetota bacterium]
MTHCRHAAGDAVSRRSFICVGALAPLGITLADLLRAEAAAGSSTSSRRSVVNIHLDGGPPHMDMIDLKPTAPVEIRGEYRPIATNLPGLEVGELMPKLATIAERFTFIRSLTDSAGAHDAFQCQSGHRAADLQAIGGRPALGCVVSKLQGSKRDASPPFVDLMQGRALVRNSARPGFLGPAYQAFRPDISHLFARKLEAGMEGELARRGANHAVSYVLNETLNGTRLDNRLRLLADFDGLRRRLETDEMMQAMDGFQQQAVGILTSGRLAAALDLSQEDPRTAAKYELNLSTGDVGTSDSPTAVRKLLLARRLLEAGVRCVSLSLSDYDTHSGNFSRLRFLLPTLDHALHAFTTDLAERGMLDDVAIVVWGEFGRTPKINSKGGRDHWPAAGMCLLAGGGLRHGQVIGATDRYGAAVTSRPVRYVDVVATLYSALGIDPSHATVTDPSGRPQHVAGDGQVIRETA